MTAMAQNILIVDDEEEIADLLEISQSSVKRYLRSGKEHLAGILQRQGGEFYV